MNTQPQYLVAGARQRGRRCPSCAVQVEAGDMVSVCQVCDTVRHRACWIRNPACCAITCAPARAVAISARSEVLRITHQDLEQVIPLAPRWPTGDPALDRRARELPRTNRMAISAFVVALAGIPFFGLLTGLVAIVLGCLALSALQNSGQRGIGLAILGVVVGLGDVMAWLVLLYYVFSQPGLAWR